MNPVYVIERWQAGKWHIDLAHRPYFGASSADRVLTNTQFRDRAPRRVVTYVREGAPPTDLEKLFAALAKHFDTSLDSLRELIEWKQQLCVDRHTGQIFEQHSRGDIAHASGKRRCRRCDHEV